jgi:hypothetical protein
MLGGFVSAPLAGGAITKIGTPGGGALRAMVAHTQYAYWIVANAPPPSGVADASWTPYSAL